MKTQASEIVRLDIPATYRHLSVVSETIADVLSDEPLDDHGAVLYAIQLAAHEACTNIVEHAYEERPHGRIMLEVQLSHNPYQLVIDIRDTGRSFNIEAVPTPDLDIAHVSGYGVFLIRNLMDEVCYTPMQGGNHWHLVKRLRRAR